MESLSREALNALTGNELAAYYQNHAVPQRFNAGVIVASVLVSFIGSYTTLLLLGRRTATTGRGNIILLVSAAITMSASGIWSMHFLGLPLNLEASSTVRWYVNYSSGFTVMSLFLPAGTLVVAFLFLGSQTEINIFRLLTTSIICGGVIGLMHYSAAFHASFRVTYRVAQTVVSLIVACAAATTALFLFFRFRASWLDRWYYKPGCATLLATGVSSMHYIALWGTSWYVRPGQTDPSQFSLGRTTTITRIIAISIMCLVLCIVILALLLSDRLAIIDTRKKSQQVVVASATFDKQGRLLVTADGRLPSRVINTDMPLEDIMRAFSPRNSKFLWMYSLSWTWDVLAPFMKDIQTRAYALAKSTPITKSSRRSSVPLTQAFNMKPRKDDIRARFIDAACLLAQELAIPMEDLGVLFDQALQTGTERQQRRRTANEKKAAGASDDTESSIFTVRMPTSDQAGVSLFLVRELSNGLEDLAEEYAKSGYRFSETRFLSPIFADRMLVDRSEMDCYLNQLKVFARRGTRPVVVPDAVYVSLFGVRASHSRESGVDVLVYAFSRHQIPAFRLPAIQGSLGASEREWVARMRDYNIDDVMRMCEKESSQLVHVLKQSEREGDFNEDAHALYTFQTALYVALEAMRNELAVYPSLSTLARLSPTIVDVPSSTDDSAGPASMIVFEVILTKPLAPHLRSDLVVPGEYSPTTYVADAPGAASFVFTPYALFSRTQAMLLKGLVREDFIRDASSDLNEWFPSEAFAIKPLGSPKTDLKGPATFEKKGQFFERPVPIEHPVPLSPMRKIRTREKPSPIPGQKLMTAKEFFDDLENLSDEEEEGDASKGETEFLGDAWTAPSPRTGGKSAISTTNSSPVLVNFSPKVSTKVGSTPAAQHRPKMASNSSHQGSLSTLSETMVGSSPKSAWSHASGGMASRANLPVTGMSPLTEMSSKNGSKHAVPESPASGMSATTMFPTIFLTKKRPKPDNVLPVFARLPSVRRARADAVQARLRADGWHLRSVQNLESGAHGEELLGVEW